MREQPPEGQLRVTVLGCGGSTGVPVIGNDWGDCDPNDRRNARTRASLFIEGAGTSILIDTSPDIRTQLLREEIGQFDAILFTHHHADHTNGLDDLRPISWRNKGPVPMYGSAETLEDMSARFPYIFAEQTGAAGKLYRPFVTAQELTPHQQVGGLSVQAFEQDHHTCISMGFRIGDFAYSTDVARLDDEAFAALEGLDTWIVDCTRRQPHPSHAHMDQTMAWIEQVKPKRAILTHMNFTLNYADIDAETPDHVTPAYDGLSFTVPL